MANDRSPTQESLNDILLDLRSCQDEITIARAKRVTIDSAPMLARIDSLANRGHALWPQGEEHRGPAFEDILRVKADIQNLAVECRRALSS
ncbi:hypothetical protein [Paraburkholderia ginsengisoli]|uniref:Uncharacterized protein n=1 Tax=Paraburkholderia ginsengisoli TaxID=311231 RepID=A0A7T4N9S7_9BURK|nr:hypothetical protein [Paraburkholderia ginsengisoli]QQC67869.1 hypothetical protein I6I06_29045 [Paraburkholderia ginsengisoli]